MVTGANLSETTSRGFTQAQLASTANYQAKDLQGINLTFNDLTGWDFSGQNLSGARLSFSALTGANLTGANLSGAFLNSSTLTGANLSGAVVTGASFWGTTSRGFTRAQLESTASYQAKNLQGITLGRGLFPIDLIGWDFSGQNLTNAQLNNSRLIGANLSGANLTGAELYYSTLIGANLSGANLTGAFLNSSTLTDANLTGANLKNANLDLASETLQLAVFDSTTVYNQWTVFPDEFYPVAKGLTLDAVTGG